MAQQNVIYKYIPAYISPDYPLDANELDKSILLFVNVTHCAPNSKEIFEILTKLNRLYKRGGLKILAFPCFQFGLKQTRDDLIKYIKDNGYDIGYIMKEIEVNGPKTCPLYVHLKEKIPSTQGFVLTGNFTYFFADTRGKVIQRLPGTATFHELDDMIYQLL